MTNDTNTARKTKYLTLFALKIQQTEHSQTRQAID